MGTDVKSRLIARRGELYLIARGDQGVVVDTENVERFRPFNLESILRRGYWENVKPEEDNAEIVKGLMLVPMAGESVEATPAVVARKSLSDLAWLKNCGTGGGGFKPKNTCAKGGGSSAGFDTRMRYREADGRYYDERFELHRQIIKDTIGDSIPVKNPVATFLGGGTASGKSSLMKSGKAGGKNAVVVDPDAIKEKIPEYQQWKSAGNKGAASNVHLESVDVAKAVTKVALKKGHHVVVDRVGDTGMAYLQDSVDKARASGATKVVAHYTTTDIGTALDRARERAEQTGRYVPQSYIRESHANVARILPQAMESSRLFDQATLWDTTNGLVKVASSVSGKMKIHNQDLWDRFVDSGRRG